MKLWSSILILIFCSGFDALEANAQTKTQVPTAEGLTWVVTR